jgi:hypothetical protein
MRPTYSDKIGDIPINILDKPHEHPPLNRRITTIPKPTRDALRAVLALFPSVSPDLARRITTPTT